MKTVFPKMGPVKRAEDEQARRASSRRDRLGRVRLSKNAVLRREYRAQMPWWRRPAVGFILTIPIVAFLTALIVLLQKALTSDIPGAVLLLAVLFTALIWGVGPALFSLLLSVGVLDYFFVPPSLRLNIYTTHGVLRLIPFMICGMIIAFITAQREYARLQALAAEYEAEEAAQELEESNRKLQEASDLKDRFLSIASHELKTPITAIRGQAQLLLRRLARERELLPEMQDVYQSLERINEQTKRLTALIDELLDVSVIRSGKVELHRRPCDLVALCREVIDDQHMLSGRTIILHSPCEHLTLYADCERLAQVIINLVSNALKYSSPDSEVEVGMSQQEQWVRLEVIDHGKGIPKEEQDRIFETFYRAPDTRSSVKGLGLGLAITRDIVERHKGRIWCESEPGQGSRFVVELPLE
jgi:signal transduction histidine kinase